MGDGAGLGLAITKSIVEAHGGTIDVTSSERITRFVATFRNQQVWSNVDVSEPLLK